MRASNPILLLSLFFTIGCRKDHISIPDNYDIILVAGQSNTHYGYGYDSTFDATHKDVFQLARFELDEEIIPAAEPLHHHSKKDSCVGFALTFAKLYVQEYLQNERKVLIIPCGLAGSSFMKGDWNPGDHYYEDAVNRTKHTLRNNPGSRLSAILWHQGESDDQNPAYKESLDGMIQQMRIDLGLENVPFILGGMVPYWVEQNESLIAVADIISETPNRLPHCGYANPNYPFVIEKLVDEEDQVHYDSNGQRELGRRYFIAYRELVHP